MKRTYFLISALLAFCGAVNFSCAGFANQVSAGAIHAERFLSLKPYENRKGKRGAPSRYMALRESSVHMATKPKKQGNKAGELLVSPLSGDKNKLLLSIFSEAQ